MGLDMYLTAERYFWFGETPPKIEGMPEGYKAKTVTAAAAYWRKANHIHQWFVDNVQDGKDECRPHDVSREQLQTLVDLCKEVLADMDKAPALLPSQPGFFFGTTDYDEWYRNGCQITIDQIEKALAAFPKGWGFQYRSSW